MLPPAALAAAQRAARAPGSGNKRQEAETIARTDTILENQLALILAGLMPENRLVIQVMLRTGLRVSDVLELRRAQIGRQFTVTEKKTGKRKKCGLPDWLITEIMRYSAGSEWAFPSPKNPRQHRTRQAVWRDIKRIQRALRLPVNLGTHSARKAYAVHLMQQYGDLEKVRRDMNHSSTTITMLYAMADMLVQDADTRRRNWKRRR